MNDGSSKLLLNAYLKLSNKSPQQRTTQTYYQTNQQSN